MGNRKKINSKVLLFSNYNFEKYQGGPSGFISQNILNNDIKDLITLQSLENEVRSSKLRPIIKRITEKITFKILGKSEKPWLENFVETAGDRYKKLNSSRFKYVFFHDVFSLYGCLKYIPENQQIILQSHAPQLVSEEFNDLHDDDVLTKKVQIIEKKAFERANYLIFPHHGAELIYESLITKRSKVIYILSASREIIDPTQLPLNNSVNILYIGRRNAIKGFDILIESFKRVRLQCIDINLILAGDGDKIDSEGIISLGHVNPDNWIKSVDYVINVNRNSYFDLSVIEVLSIGTPLILAINGGHTFFKQKSKGIIEIETLTSDYLVKILSQLKKNSVEEKIKMVKENRKLYHENFTLKHYKIRLERFINNLQ